MKGFQLIATGGALPGRTVTNEELSRTVDTSDAWITSRTGIRTRHWCTADESAATLAIAAAKHGRERAEYARFGQKIPCKYVKKALTARVRSDIVFEKTKKVGASALTSRPRQRG